MAANKSPVCLLSPIAHGSFQILSIRVRMEASGFLENSNVLLEEHPQHLSLSVSHHQPQGFLRLGDSKSGSGYPELSLLQEALDSFCPLPGSHFWLTPEGQGHCPVGCFLGITCPTPTPTPAGLLSALQKFSAGCHLGSLDLQECLVAMCPDVLLGYKGPQQRGSVVSRAGRSLPPKRIAPWA